MIFLILSSTVVQCPALSRPERGFMTCSDPLGPSSYQSTCEFTCEEGYVLSGSPSNTLQCEASGTWNSPQPFCVGMPTFTFSNLQYFTISVPLLWEKIYVSLKRLLLTFSVLSVLQLSSVPLFRSWRMALPAVEKTQTWSSATETPAASAVCPATACRVRAVWPARQKQSGVRPLCLAVKVRAHSNSIPAIFSMIKISFLDFCFCDKHF